MVYVYKDGKFELIGDAGINLLKNTEQYKNLTLVESDKVINSVDDYKRVKKQEVSKFTDSYIHQKLASIDEDLADLVTERSWLEGVFASQNISPEQVRNETVLVVLGKETEDEAVKNLSIPQDFVSDFQRAVEIAKIIAWKEQVWKAEAKLESQVDGMTLEELLQLDVRKLCEDAYSQIPLEV